MRHLTVVVLGFATFAAAAEARGPQFSARLPSFAGPLVPAVRSPDYSTRMAFDAGTGRSNSFVAALPVSPAATIGIGRFYAMPRRRTALEDQPVTMQGKKQRRAAVGLSLKF